MYKNHNQLTDFGNKLTNNNFDQEAKKSNLVYGKA